MENVPQTEKPVVGKPFEPGNPGGPGRPRGRSLTHQLLEAVECVETRHRKPLLEYFVERAYTSDRVLIALLKKLIPDLGQHELRLTDEERNKAAVQQWVDLIRKYVPDPAQRLKLIEEIEGLDC